MTDEKLTEAAAAIGLRLGRIRWGADHRFFLERLSTGNLLFDGQSMTKAEVENFLTGQQREAVHAG
jgi:hypothetical protein